MNNEQKMKYLSFRWRYDDWQLFSGSYCLLLSFETTVIKYHSDHISLLTMNLCLILTVVTTVFGVIFLVHTIASTLWGIHHQKAVNNMINNANKINNTENYLQKLG